MWHGHPGRAHGRDARATKLARPTEILGNGSTVGHGLAGLAMLPATPLLAGSLSKIEAGAGRVRGRISRQAKKARGPQPLQLVGGRLVVPCALSAMYRVTVFRFDQNFLSPPSPACET